MPVSINFVNQTEPKPIDLVRQSCKNVLNVGSVDPSYYCELATSATMFGQVETPIGNELFAATVVSPRRREGLVPH